MTCYYWELSALQRNNPGFAALHIVISNGRCFAIKLASCMHCLPIPVMRVFVPAFKLSLKVFFHHGSLFAKVSTGLGGWGRVCNHCCGGWMRRVMIRSTCKKGKAFPSINLLLHQQSNRHFGGWCTVDSSAARKNCIKLPQKKRNFPKFFAGFLVLGKEEK